MDCNGTAPNAARSHLCMVSGQAPAARHCGDLDHAAECLWHALFMIPEDEHLSPAARALIEEAVALIERVIENDGE
jgi:hypothetical protein